MHKVCGLTLLERTMRAALAVQPLKLIPVIGYQHAILSAHISEIARAERFSQVALHPVIQEPQGGTGHAVQVAVEAFSAGAKLCAILSGDMPLIEGATISNLLENFEHSQLDLGFLSVKVADPAYFGRIIRDENGRVKAIVEAKDCSPAQLQIDEVNASVYLAKVDFLKQALSSLQPNNAQAELYLPDIVQWGVRNSFKVEAFIHADPVELLGANSIAELSALEVYRRGQLNRKWMNQGVTFENPDCAYLDEDVQLEADCFIGANTRLRGRTSVSQGAILDGDSLIENSEIGEQARIKLGCVIESSQVGKNASVGPYAHLREGTVLEEKVKLGNFVETKKSTLKRGVKAGHLSYLGDAIIGEDTNIGAGTITCNYDGKHKHKTSIGQGVFIGSDTAIVAPVTIGDGAFVGAGSVITKDVPVDALAVARGRQVIKADWAKSRK